jgi:hypothetical protein
MNNMTITNAKYNLQHNENCSVTATVDGVVLSIPLDPANRHYAEIMRQVAAGELTIADAD